METIRKHSRKRAAILDCIRATDTHPTADWVYAQLKPKIPDLSLGTVYRNLTMFKQEGLVISVGVVNGQERFDGRVEPHVHFICQSCGAVQDAPVDAPMDELARLVEQKTGGHVTGHRLSFTGLCARCKEQAERADTTRQADETNPTANSTI